MFENQSQSLERLTARRESIGKDYRQFREQVRLKMDDFHGVYSDEEIERDKRLVAERRSRFESVEASPAQEAGIVTEVLLYKSINGGPRIFGERARAALLSEYDDYGFSDPNAREERGAWSDAVIEFSSGAPQSLSSEPYRFAAAVDFTSSASPKVLDEKLRGLKSALDTERLATVKYFKSAGAAGEPTYAGKLAGIPKLVVSCDAETAWRAASLLESGASADELLQKDPFIRTVLAECLMQCDSFENYARSRLRNAPLVQKFDEGTAHLLRALEEKQLAPRSFSERAVLASPGLRALGASLIRLGFQVKSPADIILRANKK